MFQHEDEFPRPRVFILVSALQKLRAYVKICSVEINGLGVVKRFGSNFLITDVFILSQQASMISVKVDDLALHKFIFEQVRNGGDPAEIKLQWHSHVNMEAYCSGEDRRTISGYKSDFMISLVMNKRDESFCRIDLFKPFRLGFAAPLEVFVPPDSELEDRCEEEIKEKVKIISGPDITSDLKELLENIESIEVRRTG